MLCSIAHTYLHMYIAWRKRDDENEMSENYEEQRVRADEQINGNEA